MTANSAKSMTGFWQVTVNRINDFTTVSQSNGDIAVGFAFQKGGVAENPLITEQFVAGNLKNHCSKHPIVKPEPVLRLGTKEAYGQLLPQDFNLLEQQLITAYGQSKIKHSTAYPNFLCCLKQDLILL